MKFKMIVLSMAMLGIVFTSCEDGKKKDAEVQAQAEEMRMEREADSLRVIEDSNSARMADMESNSIAAKAMDTEDLSRLTGALQAADMNETLRAEGDYTVFAPLNSAFEKVSKAELDKLMDPANKADLQKLLNYHVVAGTLMSTDVMAKVKEGKGTYEVTTLNGEKLTLSDKDGKMTVKDAKGNVANVVAADIDASNGVVYTIDKVLMPKM